MHNHMERDGDLKSIWQEANLRSKARGDSARSHFEVIIIGGGIAGITTALKLQEAGRSCLVLEARNPGYGTTGGTSAHLNTVLDVPYTELIRQHGLEKAKLVAQSAASAIQDIRRNAKEYHIDCDLQVLDGYMYADKPEQLDELKREAEAIAQVGIPVTEGSEVPVPYPVAGAIRFGGQGQFHPTLYLDGLIKAFLSLGGALVNGVRVTSIEDWEQDVKLVKDADDQSWSANYVIHATHTPIGVQLLHLRLVPYRSYIQVYELEDSAPYPTGLIYDLEDPFHYIRTVRMGEQRLLMVGGEDHKTGHEPNAGVSFDQLEAFVRGRFPIREKKYEWSSQFYESPDGLPFIGQMPGKKQELVATGFDGNGMIYGTLSARILTALILGKEHPCIELYNPARIGSLSGLASTLKENIHVAVEFVKGRFRPEKVEGLAEMAAGEGRVLKYEGQKIAVYKDALGAIMAVAPTCTHMGCMVDWNNAELSWDCPCHGARYAPDGSVLNGPTTAPLKKWNWEENQVED